MALKRLLCQNESNNLIYNTDIDVTETQFYLKQMC